MAKAPIRFILWTSLLGSQVAMAMIGITFLPTFEGGPLSSQNGPVAYGIILPVIVLALMGRRFLAQDSQDAQDGQVGAGKNKTGETMQNSKTPAPPSKFILSLVMFEMITVLGILSKVLSAPQELVFGILASGIMLHLLALPKDNPFNQSR